MRALSGGLKGGIQSPKHFVKNSVKEVKYHKMCQNVSPESQKSPNLTHGTQESETFPQKLFTEKSKSQSCK